MCKIKKKMDAIVDGMYGWVMRQPVSQIKDPKMFAMEAVREFDARMKSLLLDQKLMTLPLINDAINFKLADQEELPKEGEVDLKTARAAILDATPRSQKGEDHSFFTSPHAMGRVARAKEMGGILIPEVFAILCGYENTASFYSLFKDGGWRGIRLKKWVLNVSTGETYEDPSKRTRQYPEIIYAAGENYTFLKLVFKRRGLPLPSKMSLPRLYMKTLDAYESILKEKLPPRPYPWVSRDFFVDLVKSATAPV